MGLHAEIVDFDEEFAKLDFTPIIVNDYNTSIPEEKEALDRHFYTHYQNSDTIEEAASCDCGLVTGMYNLGVHCEICNSPVQGTTDKPIQSVMWMRAPDGVKGLISPAVWMILERSMRTNEFNFLEYLTNTAYFRDVNTMTSADGIRKVERLLAHDPPRGLNNFIEHFDSIMEFMFDQNIINANSGVGKGELWEFIQQNKHKFFPQHLPFPSKVCFVIESTTSGVYVDKPLGLAMNALLTVTGITASPYPLHSNVVQNRVAKAIRELASFYDAYTKGRLAKKPGLIRRHIIGSRLHFTARCVITSLSEPHDFDEVHVPWGMAIQLLKYHIINKLLKRGVSANKALEFVYSNVMKYNEEMDLILKELIAEAPPMVMPDGTSKPGGIRFSWQRNPTLQRGSMQQLRITKVKPQVHINTVSMSVGVLRAPISLSLA